MSSLEHQDPGPKARRFTRPVYQDIHQLHIADGFVDDVEELLLRCSKVVPLTFERFTDIWMEMNMGCFYHERTVGAEIAELSEEVIHIAKRFLVADTSRFEESVVGLFLVYCLLTLQPFKGFAALRLVPEDMPAIRRIELVARREKRYDVLYILGQILIRGPVQFHAASREYGFEPTLRKYHEGIANLDNLVRPKGVFYRQSEEMDIIKELQNITKQYEEAKSKITDQRGRQDPNLRYADKEIPSQLDCSLRRIITGFMEEEEAPCVSGTSNIEDRSDRIRDIKNRAMSHAIDSMRHLTGVNDKRANPSSTITSPSKKSNTVANPTTTVISGSPQKRKTGKKKARRPKAKKPRQQATAEIEELPSLDDTTEENNTNNDEINTEQFQRVEVEVENINEGDGQPNIDELVEKEYDIHIDTMPIVIKTSVEGVESDKIEIEFIDHYKRSDKVNEPEKTVEEKIEETKNKMNKLPDVSFTKVGSDSLDSSLDTDTDDEIADQTTKNLNEMMSKVVKTKYKETTNNKERRYHLKKPERRELKKRHLKSKFKKLGLESLANFKESKKLKNT